jgi:hypothetical protein
MKKRGKRAKKYIKTRQKTAEKDRLKEAWLNIFRKKGLIK